MKLRLMLVAAIALATSTAFAQAPKKELRTAQEKFSYGFGMMIGRNLKKQSIDKDIDPELLIQGFREGLANSKMLMTEQQAMDAIKAFEEAMAAKREKESKDFLAANKKQPGVKTTPSGLQYKVVAAGKAGAKPKPTDSVSVIYRGRFPNGAEFDSSGGKEFVIGVNDVIDGWKEALQMMDVGSKWQLYIPAELAYGEQGQPPIGPNATLIFDLELKQIVKNPNAPVQR